MCVNLCAYIEEGEERCEAFLYMSAQKKPHKAAQENRKRLSQWHLEENNKKK